jgi:hypothetical protein
MPNITRRINMNRSIGFAMFIFGAVVGSAAAWRFAKRKYEKIANDEIDSVKESFSKRKDAPPTTGGVTEKPELAEYVLKASNYNGFEPPDQNKSVEKAAPYVISPEEFSEDDAYAKISLTLYAGDILVDDNDGIVENAEELIGSEWRKYFKDYDEDSVYVRNDARECDFEIIFDNRRYSDV